MIKISVKGMNDGNYDIDLSFPSEGIKNLGKEFFGEINIYGKMVKLKNRYNFDGYAECNAMLICDRSLKEYKEKIKTELKWTCMRDTEQHLNEETKNMPGNLTMHNDEQEIDITEEVTEQLTVAIPMKKVSPEFRDKDINEIYPEHSVKEEDKIDSRWSKLKEIKFN